MAQIDIKIQSVADLAALKRAIDEVGRGEAAVRRFKAEGSGVGEIFRLGFGIGTGVELARRALDILKSTIVDTAREAFVMAGQIKDGAEALGVTRKEYQVLGQVMEDAGGKQDRMSQAIEKNNRSLLDARSQTGAAAAAYRTLGLSAAELESLPVPRRLEAIARAIAGAKDQTAAFGAAGDILGSKNLPVLLSALRALGSEGYDALAQKMDKAGKIMSDGTIERLEKAQKAIDGFKRQMTIEVGESIAALSILKQSAQKGFGETFLGVLKASLFNDYSSLAQTLIKNVPEAVAKPALPPDNTASAKAAALLEEKLVTLKALKLRLLESELAFDDQQKSIHLTDEEKRAKEVDFLNNKFRLLLKIRDLTEALPLGEQDPAARATELARLNADIISTNTSATNVSAPLTDAAQRNREFATFQSGKNAQGGERLNPLDGVTAGLQDFLMQAGTVGEQVAATMTSTIGAAVSGISDGIYGWITGTQSWGQAMLQMGRSVLKGIIDQVVQIGVQQLINGNIFKVVMLGVDALSNALRIGRVAKDNAAEAATLPLKTAGAAAAGVSSYGGALVFGALAIALIAAAALSGFADGGYISGPGGPRDDSILARVSNKEYIQTAKVTQDPKYAWLMSLNEAARLGKQMPAFADGGAVGFDAVEMIPSVGASLARPQYASESSAGSSVRTGSLGGSDSERPIVLNIANHDTREGAQQWLETQAGRRYMINFLRAHRYEV